jgi:hypothetical protein
MNTCLSERHGYIGEWRQGVGGENKKVVEVKRGEKL